MRKEVLNKNVTIGENSVIIIQEIKTEFNKSQLETQLLDIQIRKSRLKEQNKKLIAEHEELLIEEAEVKLLISELNDNVDMEEI